VTTWRDLPTPGAAGPKRLSTGLDRVARGLGAPGAAVLAAVFGRWAEIVGPDLARSSRPLWLAGGTLVVGVGDPSSSTELRYRADEVLDRVAEVAGDRVAERLEVRVRPRR
jgi:predicted nucleic acid-binding Zn ribbon protein